MLRFILLLCLLALAACLTFYGYEFRRVSKSWPPNWDVPTMGTYALYSTSDKLGLPPEGERMNRFQQLIAQQIAYSSYLGAAKYCETTRCSAAYTEQLEAELYELQRRPIPGRR